MGRRPSKNGFGEGRDKIVKADAQEIKRYRSDYFVNVGTGEDLTIKELALMIKDIIGYKGDIKHDLSKPDGTPRKLLDVSKIRDMGWVAKIPLREGIREVYQNYVGFKADAI